jgi:1-acyl-sn-glycerol-3-phosphate acyltransferase
MKKKKVYPTKLSIRFLTFIVFTAFAWIYNIKKKMPKDVKKLKSPYLVLGNHIGYWDPFVTGNFLPRFTHFVSSDAAFRNPKIRFFLNGLGTIPKKKNIRDSKVIRDIAAVIAQGENVGIFPEAVRNWAGRTQPMDKSIAKLIKMLKVPVVVPLLKGMNLFNPRWSKKLRKARVTVEYNLLINAEEVERLSVDEIFEKLTQAIEHDEVEYQRKEMIKIRSNIRAEHISHTLYICPECSGIDTFRCKGNDFACETCGYDIHIDEYGFYERKSEGKLHYDNIRDWFEWEEEKMLRDVRALYDKQFEGIIFEDLNSEIYHSAGDIDLKFIGHADLKLYINRIEVDFKAGNEKLTFNFDDLKTINPQVHERLEIFYNNDTYRVIGSRPGVSALKWEVALNAVWKRMGQIHKLSPYIRHLKDN